MLRTERTPWPREVPVVQQMPPSAADDDEIVITFVGHSTFLLQSRAGNIITDPVYSMNAGPFGRFGPRRVRRPAVAFDDLPEISLVLLSHNHYDHCDPITLRKLVRRFDPAFVTPIGNARLVRRAGARRVQELNWWDTASAGNHDITLTPARHFSARTPFDRNKALWGGFMFGMCGGRLRIFFAGDSGYGAHFTQIANRLGSPDVALIPIGAYEPRWFMQPIHMNPEEAVRAHSDLGSRQSLAMHFGTFQLTPEGIDEPAKGLARAVEGANIPLSAFRVLEHGQSFVVGSR